MSVPAVPRFIALTAAPSTSATRTAAGPNHDGQQPACSYQTSASAPVAATNTVAFSSPNPCHEHVPDERLDQEISILRKRREYLLLQRQIKEMEQPAAAPTADPAIAAPANGRTTVSIRDVRLVPRPYDGSPTATYDVHKFLADVEQFFGTVEHNATYRFLALRSLLSEAAADFLTDSQAMTYEGLRDELIREFGRVLSTTELIDQLRGRRWYRNTESMHRYVIRMQGLARRGNIPEAEFIDIIVDNMRLPREDANLLMTCSPTVPALNEAICRHEKRVLANLARSASYTNRAAGARAGPIQRQPTAAASAAPRVAVNTPRNAIATSSRDRLVQ